MARIIEKHDEHLRAQTATHTCGRCKSTVEFDRKDVRGDQRDGDYVVCPNCGAFISERVVFGR